MGSCCLGVMGSGLDGYRICLVGALGLARNLAMQDCNNKNNVSGRKL